MEYTEGIKKQVRIAPLQPSTLAAFRPWGIKQEQVERTCGRKITTLFWNKKFL